MTRFPRCYVNPFELSQVRASYMSYWVILILFWTPLLCGQEESGEEHREKITVTPDELTNYPFEIEEPSFSANDLTVGQIQIMNFQRRSAKDIIARQLGILSIRGNKNDLSAFQQLVDRRILRDNQVEEWQWIGVLFGDVLANEFHMSWVRFEDERGFNKALRWRETGNFFFPVTMLSKRVRFGEEINFQKIYDELALDIERFIADDLKPQMPESNPSEKFIESSLD